MPKIIPHILCNGEELKRCGTCKQYLPLFEFSRNKQCRDGLNSVCHACISKICKKNRQKRAVSEKSWVLRNKEKVREYKKRYRENHPETMKAIYNRRAKKVLSTSDGRLNNLLRQVVKYSLSGNKQGKPWTELLPYTLEELKAHLEAQFRPGMTWENHTKYGWHIDHIQPIVSFKITSPDCEDFRRCWALSNLRPLWWDENLRKSSKAA